MKLFSMAQDWLAHRRRAQQAAPPQSVADGEDDDDAVDSFDPFPNPVQLELRDVFDLHTVQPREAERVVEAYLREARAAGFPVVRLIHGKGKGVQRATVRRVLARTPFVIDWTDAPPEAGGWGATIARLRTSGEHNAAR